MSLRPQRRGSLRRHLRHHHHHHHRRRPHRHHLLLLRRRAQVTLFPRGVGEEGMRPIVEVLSSYLMSSLTWKVSLEKHLLTRDSPRMKRILIPR